MIKTIFISTCLLIAVIIAATGNTFGQYYIGDIYLDQREVFDTTQTDWFFASGFVNSLHTTTKPYIIEDEILFNSGDKLNISLIEETERNLRRTGLFTDVRITLDSVGSDIYDVNITARERWTTQPSILLGSGGGETVFGGRIEELNLLGHGVSVMAEGLKRTENDIGWQGAGRVYFRRFLRSDFVFNAGIISNRFRTTQTLSIFEPYRTLDAEYSYGLSGLNSFGNDFLFRSSDSTELISFKERKLSGWFSRAWLDVDRVFITVLAGYDEVDRYNESFRQAFDNTGKILVSFSSVSQDFLTVRRINSYLTDDLVLGGYGSATLGKVFPIGSRGESLYYIGGQGEKSHYDGDLYLYGRLKAASGFVSSFAKYTYQEFFGVGFYRLSDNFLLASRIRQQSVWNWPANRQLILDNDAGLRGYEANQLSGDNRIISNLELRMFTDFEFWIFSFSSALFYDMGTVWNKNTQIFDARFHNSAGIGLRFHNNKLTGETSIFRIDFAYNFDNRKLGGIIFTTNQLFSAFGSHDYKLPQLFGTGFDYE